MVGLIVGFRWWGVGAEDLASSVVGARSLVLWDLTRRVDRQLMRISVGARVASRRVRRRMDDLQGDFSWVLVTCPHRLSAAATSQLRVRTGRLVAFLGDDPVHERSISPELMRMYDLAAVADFGWARSIDPRVPVMQAPWRSTLPGSMASRLERARPSKIAFVGSAYDERVALATKLSADHEIVTVGNWPYIPGAEQRPAAPRIETLEWLKDQNAVVINAHHRQFDRGLNPQFYDYVFAGIPQVTVSGGSGEMYLPSSEYPWAHRATDPLSDEVWKANSLIFSRPPVEFSFGRTIEEIESA